MEHAEPEFIAVLVTRDAYEANTLVLRYVRYGPQNCGRHFLRRKYVSSKLPGYHEFFNLCTS